MINVSQNSPELRFALLHLEDRLSVACVSTDNGAINEHLKMKSKSSGGPAHPLRGEEQTPQSEPGDGESRMWRVLGHGREHLELEGAVIQSKAVPPSIPSEALVFEGFVALGSTSTH